MKLLTSLLLATTIATGSVAGEVSMSSAAHLPAEQAAMGTAGLEQWIIPLIAIGFIALALSAENNEGSCKKAEGAKAIAVLC